MKTSTKTIITILLASALLAGVWSEIQRDWLPSIDGPYQTVNWCRRLLDGQVMGQDFPIFHGPGIVWYHLPFVAIFGGTVKGALAAYFGACALIIWIPAAMVARGGGASGHRAVWIGMLLVGVFACIPGSLYNSVVPAGNMLATRIALCLLPAMAFWTWRDRLPQWFSSPLLAGMISGLALATSQEQGVSVGLAFALVAVVGVWGSRSWRKLPVRLANGLAGMVVAYLAMVVLFTSGHPLGYLRFAWQELPQNQFWFFGGPPRLFVGNWKDLLDPQHVGKPLVVTLLVWVPVAVICMTRFRWIPKPILFLAAYSGFVLHPMAGYLSYHYFAAPTYAGLVAWAFVAPSLLSDLRKWIENRRPNLSINRAMTLVMITAGAGLFGMQASKNLLRPILGKNLPPAPVYLFQDGFSDVQERLSSKPSLSATAAADEMTSLVRQEGGHPWSLFAGPVEEKLGLFQPSGFDYVFYAMSEDSKAKYLESFRRKQIDCVILSRHSQSKDTQWLTKSYWELHHEILRNFEPSIAMSTQFLWTRRRQPVQEISQEVPFKLDPATDGAFLRFTSEPGTSGARLYLCRLGYSIGNGPIPLVSRRLTRFAVTADGIKHWQNTGLPVPGVGTKMVMDLPIVADTNGPVSLHLKTISPFGAPPVSIHEISVRSLDGFDPVSLAALTDDEWASKLKSSN